MSDGARRAGDERFLICAPTGRDGSLTRTLLLKAGIAAASFRDLGELCDVATREGCAGLMLAEEVLAPRPLARLRKLLQAQDSWSDLPVLLFTARSSEVSPQLLAALGNVTLLERPLRPITMLSAANSALRGRFRQYAARAELLEQQRAVQLRDQFLAMLGHELRNPLAAIAMAAQLDESNADSPYRAIVARQAKHLTRLVDDLLDVSRVTSGKISLRRSTIDVRELLERSVALMRAVLAHQSVTLTLQLPEERLAVHGDPVRLEQVMGNLLTNAAKYTPPGGHVMLRAERDDGHVRIALEDDGVGIAPEMLPRVFDLFTQAEGTLDRAKGGMGIGLTLVRTLVELHDGEVAVASKGLGQGSVFTVRLPLTDTHPERAAGRRERGRDEERPQRVLVVEDNADSRELLQLGLERRGHTVSASADGLEGVEQALAQRPDAMLVDIGLPGLDGYEVAREVRSALGPSVYLVALTGYGQPDDRARALAAGFDLHLTKPVDLDELCALLAAPQRRDDVAH